MALGTRPMPELVEIPEGTPPELARVLENIQRNFEIIFNDSLALGEQSGELPEFGEGDCSVDANNVITINENAVGTFELADAAVATANLAARSVTAAKLFAVATDKLLGRDTAGSGDVEEIGLTKSVVLDGSQGLQLSGDDTAPGNSKYYGTDSGGNKGWFGIVSSTEWDSTITKASNETVNNSAAFQDDDALQFSVTANGVYYFELVIAYTSNASANIKFQATVAAGTQYAAAVSQKLSTGGAPVGNNSEGINGLASWSSLCGGHATLPMSYTVKGWFVPSNTTTWKLQWAQNTANVSNTVVRAGSFVRYKKII
jgi:hypothetical protein